MTKIKNLKDHSSPKGLTKEELDEMTGLSRLYAQIKSRVADASMMHYQSLRNMESVEARMQKFNNDITEKYKLDDKAKIDPQTGEFK